MIKKFFVYRSYSLNFFLIVFLIFSLFSCVSENSNKDKLPVQKNQIIDCLNSNLSKHDDFFTLFEEILVRELEIEHSPKFYADLYEKIFTDSSYFKKMNLNNSERDELLHFSGEIGVPALLFECTKNIDTAEILTQHQRDFFKEYNTSIIGGYKNPEALAKRLSVMNSDDFNSNGVKEVAFYYFIYLLSREYLHWEQ